jgi:lipid II:glycine glycyltransferase (peptidoglycan interpeptide bridge formation enzyme)
MVKIKLKTVIVDLKPTEEDILKELHKNARWSIKKSIKEGVIVKESQDIKSFYKDYLEFMKKYNLTPQRIDELKKKKLVLFLGLHKNKRIGWLLLNIGQYKNFPAALSNISKKEYLKFCPNDALYWHAIKWAKKKGYQFFDMGGYASKPKGTQIGINKFKVKYGKVVKYSIDCKYSQKVKCYLIDNSKLFYWLNEFAKKIRNKLKRAYNYK